MNSESGDGGPYTVHVIPHSHNDVGWIRSIDEYFYGLGRFNEMFHNHVESELDTIIPCLLENKERTFSWVEIKFFKMWWDT